tara:strand:- start:393 stop:890 length:498 start_codon:yes stop_codon:yes gene_type:complete
MISNTDNILSITKIVDGIEETINYNRGILILKGGIYLGDIYMWNSGTWYYGSSKNGYADGNGILFENLPGNIYNKYIGEFKNGRFDGKGILRNYDGEYYRGEFIGGLRHGKGATYFLNGNIEYGNYLFGVPDGWFQITYNRSKKGNSGYTCKFNMGKIIEYGELI